MATLGIDVGCISVKMAVVGRPTDRDLFEELAARSPLLLQLDDDPQARPITGDAPPVLLTEYRRIKGSPLDAVRDLHDELLRALPPSLITGVRVTGSGGRLLSRHLGVPFENEFKAIARATGTFYPEVAIVFEMGGETSKFIHLERDVQTGCTGIADYQTNGDCAAGTGSFMDQQASRLLYSIEEVGQVVSRAGKAATIAGRCSVFAKSDMIHAQQKGYQPPEVLKGLCNAVMRNYRSTIARGKEIGPNDKVAFIGGVAANQGAVEAALQTFELRPDQLLVPTCYAWMGAIGAALLHADDAASQAAVTASFIDPTLAVKTSTEFPRAQALSLKRVILLRDRIRPYTFAEGPGAIDAYLGVDVGSVSTNLVVLDDAGEVVKEIYMKTDGRPVEVVNKGLAEIWEEMGPRLRIRGVGTTGSGRELIGELMGADTVNDEITAHKTGATFIGRKLIDRVPDTIFEVGGQDSKYISLQDGVVVDFAMNEACAAGTGSFLEEQAEKLGINIIGEFAELALSSEAPIRLGERCTVFMERDVNSYLQRGAARRDLVAGLAYSIAYNYLNRVVGKRHIGDTVYFQGGTAYNDAVAAAFSMILDQEVIVPPHNGVVGAIGMALLARQKMVAIGGETRFRGWDLEQVDYSVREFTCKGCTNECDIRRFTIGGERTYWGDKCSDRYRKRAKVDTQPVIADLPGFRERLLFSYVSGEVPASRGEIAGSPRAGLDTALAISSGSGAALGTVGIPRAMYTYDRLPFWAVFLRMCGFDVLVSPESDRRIREAGVEGSVAEPCFPIRVAHGHVIDLLERGVDYVFIPNLLNEETDHPDIESHACPWGQTLPWVIAAAPRLAGARDRMLAPTLHFRRGPKSISRALRDLVRPLGVRPSVADRAVAAAYAAQTEFRVALLEAGAEALNTLEERGEMGIVLVGRSYNIYDAGTNMDIPAKLRRYYGVNLIPIDFLPLWGEDTRDITANMFWNYGRKILQAAMVISRYPHLHLIYLTNFKCGPDSYVKHFIRRASDDPFLTLQFDEHTNDAGVMTRCEAYLDSKGFLRRWSREGTATCQWA